MASLLGFLRIVRTGFLRLELWGVLYVLEAIIALFGLYLFVSFLRAWLQKRPLFPKPLKVALGQGQFHQELDRLIQEQGQRVKVSSPLGAHVVVDAFSDSSQPMLIKVKVKKGPLTPKTALSQEESFINALIEPREIELKGTSNQEALLQATVEVLQGLARLKADQPAHAQELFEKAEGRCSSPGVEVFLGICYRLQRPAKYQKAEEAFRSALKHEPTMHEALHNLGLLMLEVGLSEDAISLLKQAHDLKPEVFYTALALARALDLSNRSEEALKYFQKASQLEPRGASLYLSWGVCLAKRGMLEKAKEAFDKAIELRPGMADAHYNKGIALDEQGKVEEAIAHFDKAVKADPLHAEAILQWGFCLLRQRAFKQASERFKRAAALKPSNALTYLYWGMALKEMGLLSQAEAKFERASQLDPSLAEAYLQWGYILELQGHSPEAKTKFQRAFQLNPKLQT